MTGFCSSFRSCSILGRLWRLLPEDVMPKSWIICAGLLLISVESVSAQQVQGAQLVKAPPHTPAIIRRATEYSKGYVLGNNRTIDAGQTGTYSDWNKLGLLACGTDNSFFQNGCMSGVYNTMRWATSRERYTGPQEWLNAYDQSFKLGKDDCGNGSGPSNDGCRYGAEVRAAVGSLR